MATRIMGTSGLFGFVHKGRYYVVYNHMDSYPKGLGAKLAREIDAAGPAGLERWKAAFDNEELVVVRACEDDEDDENNTPEPTAEDAARLAPYAYDKSDPLGARDWDLLTYKCQGSLVRVMKSGYVFNRVNVHGEPLWEEHAFLVNFDCHQFEHYIGSTLARAWGLDEVTADLFEADIF
jgi:hypothetical protein